MNTTMTPLTNEKPLIGTPVLLNGKLFVVTPEDMKAVKDGQSVLLMKQNENKVQIAMAKLKGEDVSPISFSGTFKENEVALVMNAYNQLHKGEVSVKGLRIGQKPADTKYTIVVS